MFLHHFSKKCSSISLGGFDAFARKILGKNLKTRKKTCSPDLNLCRIRLSKTDIDSNTPVS